MSQVIQLCWEININKLNHLLCAFTDLSRHSFRSVSGLSDSVASSENKWDQYKRKMVTSKVLIEVNISICCHLKHIALQIPTEIQKIQRTLKQNHKLLQATKYHVWSISNNIMQIVSKIRRNCLPQLWSENYTIPLQTYVFGGKCWKVNAQTLKSRENQLHL